jgi:hypothetical protein
MVMPDRSERRPEQQHEERHRDHYTPDSFLTGHSQHAIQGLRRLLTSVVCVAHGWILSSPFRPSRQIVFDPPIRTLQVLRLDECAKKRGAEFECPRRSRVGVFAFRSIFQRLAADYLRPRLSDSGLQPLSGSPLKLYGPIEGCDYKQERYEAGDRIFEAFHS